MALAANIRATVPLGSTQVVAGIAVPLVLPVVLWIRSCLVVEAPRHSVGWWAVVAVRELSVVAVAGPAAALSYWHTYTLMVEHMPWQIAIVIPLSSDGVATISTLALHRGRTRIQRKRQKSYIPAPDLTSSSTRRSPVKPSDPAPVVPKPVADEVQTRRGDRAVRIAWVQAQQLDSWTDRVTAVERQFSVSRSTAKRIVQEAAS